MSEQDVLGWPPEGARPASLKLDGHLCTAMQECERLVEQGKDGVEEGCNNNNNNQLGGNLTPAGGILAELVTRGVFVDNLTLPFKMDHSVTHTVTPGL